MLLELDEFYTTRGDKTDYQSAAHLSGSPW